MKKIILSILVLSSILFLALALQNFNAPEPSAPTPDVTYSSVIEKDRLQKLDTILQTTLSKRNDPIIAVFFMYAKNCNACFNEVNGYISLLNKKNKTRTKKITTYGIFHHLNANVALRFKHTTDLQFDKKIALNGQKLDTNGYLDFNGKRATNQLVFFNHNGDLFSRILLPTGITTIKEKKEEVLNLILN